ncbi:hypothetical protein [Belnapia moabensis]|uniref:hypothetical protein n=1 Tax=Belnapia moabensis TaxID=365533 RepID=UPI001B80BFD3|nr:hypothetical protein [Belnapia moabensis]
MPVALLPARQDGCQHHNYLILAHAGSEKAAEDAGFYYAASAAARLSGILTQRGGLQACLWSSAAMLAACMALTFVLPESAGCRFDWASIRQVLPHWIRHFDECR